MLLGSNLLNFRFDFLPTLLFMIIEKFCASYNLSTIFQHASWSTISRENEWLKLIREN